ncbi:hypothetical protein ACFL5V_02805 [Fibrobacterota bacterium]
MAKPKKTAVKKAPKHGKKGIEADKKIIKHHVMKISAGSDSGQTYLILVFDSGVPEYTLKKAKYHGTPVAFLKIAATDFFKLNIPPTDRPVSHLEAVIDSTADTVYVKMYFYLEELIAPQITRGEKNLKLSFPGKGMPEEIWPYKMESITYLSVNPFKLSLKIEFDDVPRDKQIFLNRDKKKLVVVLYNTIVDTARILSPVVPFIRKFKVQQKVTDLGVAYSKLVFRSNSNLAFATREDNYKIFIDLQKEAVVVDPKWFE